MFPLLKVLSSGRENAKMRMKRQSPCENQDPFWQTKSGTETLSNKLIELQACGYGGVWKQRSRGGGYRQRLCFESGRGKIPHHPLTKKKKNTCCPQLPESTISQEPWARNIKEEMQRLKMRNRIKVPTGLVTESGMFLGQWSINPEPPLNLALGWGKLLDTNGWAQKKRENNTQKNWT